MENALSIDSWMVRSVQIEVGHLKFKGEKSTSANINWKLHDVWDLCEDKSMKMHMTHNIETGKTCPSHVSNPKHVSSCLSYHIIMCPHSKARLSLEVSAGCQQVAHWSASPATATERTTRASATKAKGWRERCSGTDVQLRISSKLQLKSN